MAYSLTPGDIREFCAAMQGSDRLIQLVIDAANCKVAPCLESAYSSCPANGELIFINLVCHQLIIQGQPGQVKTTKWADGDSQSYENYITGGTGFNATPFGVSLLQLDTAQCVINAYPNARVFVRTVGTSGSQNAPY